ncbi:hypothetical protein TeGR_g9519 [Tetraparma gracilis]|uniref:Pre-mRNA-processing factor 19 n=1 Tax=Tetraparma gracilis TaxID=2962635 RepID=A0ABQ6M5C8_9STRA|nr:hypothetical protein TeGR_g9519 [Tetraparma gracilis]
MSFVCSISGAPPLHPVASPAGNVFEKKLLVSLLQMNGGVCPLTNAPLSESDLLPLNASATAPSAPSSASGAGFPALLGTLQSEWDSLMLETYQLRLSLEETRAELSQALYQNDAAVRVIARLTMERDQARAELAAGGAAPKAAAADDAMDTGDSSTGIPAAAVEEMVKTWSELSGSRKKKIAPTDAHCPAASLGNFKEASKKSLHKASGKTGVSALALSPSGALVATGGNDKQVVVFDPEAGKVLATNAAGSKPVSSVSWSGEAAIISGGAGGEVNVFAGADFSPAASATLSSAVVDVSAQPTGSYFFAATAGGEVAFCDMEATTISTFADDAGYLCAALHPDGLIYAACSKDAVKIWDVKTSTLAASIPATSAATCVSFSENGYHFASGDADGSVTVWDLRKQKAIATVAAGGAVAQVAFDGCGKYLGYAGAGGAGAVVVKEWGTEVMKLDAKKKGYSGFAWGKDARSVVAASERVVAVYSE